jgi:DNA-binding GntR family transcriptional regulator
VFGVAEKSEQAYQLIKERILSGKISSKEPISVGGLCSELEFSRTPVRDALRRLETEGFVQIFPNQGVVVKELSSTEVTQMYELRIALEGYLLRRSIDLFTERDIVLLKELLERQREAMENNDPYAFMRLDNEQHLYLHKVYYNPIIFDVLNRMADRIYYGGVQALSLPGRMEATLEEHVKLVRAIEDRDIERAVLALENHFSRGLSSTIRSFSRA